MKCFNCGSEMRHIATFYMPPAATRFSFCCDRCNALETTSNPTFDYGQQDTFDTTDVDAATHNRLATDRLNRKDS